MTKILHRRGTATQWTTANPVLSAGEIGFETNTGKFKFGDGVTPWNTLPYFINQSQADARYAAIGSSGVGGGAFTGDADDIPDGTEKVIMTVAERTKLAGVQSGATANSADSYLLSRANHTGAQAIGTITGLQTLLDDMMAKSGRIGQLSDFPDTLPPDGGTPEYDTASGMFQYVDMNTRYVTKDSAGRIDYAALPTGAVIAAVIEEGAAEPTWLPVGGWLATVGGLADLTPLVGGHGQVTAGNTTGAAAVGQAFAAGDDIAIAVMCSAELTTPVSFTIAFSTGAASLSKRGTDTVGGTTAQVTWFTGKVTTAIPATATFIVTSKLPDGSANQNRAHMHAVIIKPQNLITTGEPFDQFVASTGGDSSVLTWSTGPTASNTAQDRELLLGVIGWNDLVTPGSREVKATEWTKIAEFSTETGASRSIAVFYKLQTVVGKPVLSGTFVSALDETQPPTDGRSGQWAASLISLRGQ